MNMILTDSEHRARVRELRKVLEDRHDLAKNELSAAEWRLREAQQVVTRWKENLAFVAKEIESFDARHKDFLPQ
jgi:hypothetical protein